MKSFYRAKKLALWTNLIPDLQIAGKLTHNRIEELKWQLGLTESQDDYDDDASDFFSSYHHYDELVSLIPQLKMITSSDKSEAPYSISRQVIPCDIRPM